MKYKINQYNIEFDVEEDEVEHVAQTIADVLVPNEFKKLYFLAAESGSYKDIDRVTNIKFVKALNINESIYTKTRLQHSVCQGQHQIFLVASGTNIFNKAKWSALCKKIQSKHHAA